MKWRTSATPGDGGRHRVTAWLGLEGAYRECAVAVLFLLVSMALGCQSPQFQQTPPRAGENHLATSAPISTGPVPTAEQVADAYVRALYAGDDALARSLYSFHSADAWPTERRSSLEGVEILSVPREHAGDRDPDSRWSYFRVITKVRSGSSTGEGGYVLGLIPVDSAGGEPRVGIASGGIQWEDATTGPTITPGGDPSTFACPP